MTFRFPRAASTRVSALLGLAWALESVSARAQPALELAWDAPAECPNEADVLNRVRSLAGESLRGSRLRAVGHIEHVNGRYRLTLSLRQGNDVRERKMESTDCDDLAGAAAVTLGLLLRKDPNGTAAGQPGKDGRDQSGKDGRDQSGKDGRDQSGKDGNAAENAAAKASSANAAQPASESKSPAPAQPRPAPAPADAKPASQAETTTKPPVEQRHWSVLLRAPFGTVDLGLLPHPMLSLGAGLGFGYDDWRFLLVSRIFDGTTVHSDALPQVGSHVARVAGEAWACREWRAARLEFGPCVDLSLSFITARGTGPHVVAASEHARVFAIGAGADGRVFLEPWLALFSAATLSVETSRPTLLVNEFGEVQQLGPVEFSLALGVEWIF